MFIKQIAQADRHRFFDDAGIVDMARDAEQLGSRVVGAAKASKPIGAAPQDGGHNCDGFDIVHGCGAAV